MSEFLLVFRRDYQTATIQPSPEKMQEHLKDWADWLRSLAAEDKLAISVQQYDNYGKVLHAQDVSEGPYTTSGHAINGLIILTANDYEEAVEMAMDSPVLELGGTVEIRQVL